jgi:hypothetical protein
VQVSKQQQLTSLLENTKSFCFIGNQSQHLTTPNNHSREGKGKVF